MKMEITTIEKDIRVFTVTASSFPEGIGEAFQKIHSFDPANKTRRCFGISRPDREGVIIYKAAAEELHEGETEKFGCEHFVIGAGDYISLKIFNYMSNPEKIGEAFQALLQHPGIDTNGYCLEWYSSDREVTCMIKLQSKK